MVTLTKSKKIPDKQCADLWVNLCCENIEPFRELKLLNQAHCGASNTEIFQQCTAAMAMHGSEIDTLFCQWTSMPRYNFHVGFELWDTSESTITHIRKHDVNLSRGDHYPRAYITDLLDRLRVLHHLRWEILRVVEFTNTIKKLAKRLGIDNVFFVNGLCLWDNDYFEYQQNVLLEAYTAFTKQEILNIESRNDDDIYALYTLAHTQYREAGGIDPGDWINLYSSFNHNKIDVNFDLVHPGKKSNLLYYDIVCKKVQNHINFSA